MADVGPPPSPKKCLPLVGPENKQVQFQPPPGPYEGIQDFSHGSWGRFDHLTKGTPPSPRSSALQATHGPIQVLRTTPVSLTQRKTVKDAIQEKGIQYCFCCDGVSPHSLTLNSEPPHLSLPRTGNTWGMRCHTQRDEELNLLPCSAL